MFDLDKTLFSCSLALDYYLYLVKEQKLSFKTLAIFSIAYLRHSFFGLSLKDLHAFIFERILCQREEKLFLDHLPSFIDIAFEHHLYYPAYEALQYARHMGYYTAIVTSSPDFLALEVAKRLGVDTVFATRYGLDQEKKFATIVNVIDGPEKAKFVEGLCKHFAIDFSQITAYSDSFLDLDFLESAGEKVGVNPDRRLKEHCKRQNWKII